MAHLDAIIETFTESAHAADEAGPLGPSYQRTLARFDAVDVAQNYPPAYGKSFRDRREVRALRKCLKHLPAGGDVLDLPCGTGRLTPLLTGAGFQVTAADASPHMLALAERRWRDHSDRTFSTTKQVEFDLQQVLGTSYHDGQFDGVICNRLFHHYNEPQTRITALTELGRICRGRVIVSFFHSFAWDAWKFRLKHAVRGTTPTDRIPIALRTLEQEADQAGLRVGARIAVLWGLSPMWYLVLALK